MFENRDKEKATLVEQSTQDDTSRNVYQWKQFGIMIDTFMLGSYVLSVFMVVHSESNVSKILLAGWYQLVWQVYNTAYCTALYKGYKASIAAKDTIKAALVSLEMKNSIWEDIICGAQALIGYAYFDTQALNALGGIMGLLIAQILVIIMIIAYGFTLNYRSIELPFN